MNTTYVNIPMCAATMGRNGFRVVLIIRPVRHGRPEEWVRQCVPGTIPTAFIAQPTSCGICMLINSRRGLDR